MEEGNFIQNYKKFETERLLIRPTSESDAQFIFSLMKTPKWIKYIGDRKVESPESAKTYILNKMHPQLRRLGYSNNTIIRKEDGAKLGTCGFFDREGLEGIDIGFALLPEYEKNGYAYEATKILIDAAINDFEIKRLCGITTKDNLSSQKLLIKLGLELVGTTRIPDDPEELLLYRREL